MNIANSSTQQLLPHHLKAVGLLSYTLGKTLFPALSDTYLKTLLLSGLLHDTGKANPSFQEFLQTKISPDSDPEDLERIEDQLSRKGNWNFHNMESWFLTATGVSHNMSPELADLLGWLVCHHHASRHKKGEVATTGEISTILKGSNRKLSGSPGFKAVAQSISESLAEYNNLIGADFSFRSVDTLPGAVPKLHHFLIHNQFEINAIARLMQSILCTADRKIAPLLSEVVAGIASINNLTSAEKHLKSLGLVPSYLGDPIALTFDNSRRTNIQRDLATRALAMDTSMLEGPAGLGKTRQALDYFSRVGSCKHYIFFVPRNSIGTELFNGTVNDLARLGSPNTTVELFLGGEVVRRHGLPSNSPGFSANIIITNIDNALNPFMKHTNIDRLMILYSAPVVGDEFHEIPSDSAIFALFCAWIRGRNLMGSKTQLMSATPVEQMSVFFGIEKMDVVSTDELAFDNNIECLFTENLEEAREFLGGVGVSIFNSRATAQRAHLAGHSDIIIHGGYSTEDKDYLINQITDLFGRDNHDQHQDKSVSASGIIQASFNVQFNAMLDSVMSPESSLQRLGRLGRFNMDACKMVFWGPNYKGHPGEVTAAWETYDNGLRELWINTLRSEFGTPKTVKKSDLGRLYKEFKRKYENEIYEYIEEKHNNSIKNVEKLDFFVGGKQKPTDKKRTGKNLRGSNSHFVYMPIISGGNITLSLDDTYLRELKDSYAQNLISAKKHMLTLRSEGFNFGSEKGLQRKGIDHILSDARAEDTPLIAQLDGRDIIVYHTNGDKPGVGVITKADIADAARNRVVESCQKI